MSIQSEYGGCRSRACMEGVRGRRRTYRCRDCGNKFRVDTISVLPEKDRICPTCSIKKVNQNV